MANARNKALVQELQQALRFAPGWEREPSASAKTTQRRRRKKHQSVESRKIWRVMEIADKCRH
jgi:hypothetical protein